MKPKALLILLFNIAIANAQQLHLTGSVIDSITNKPIANATIGLVNKNLFYPADDAGKFDISGANLTPTDSVGFSCIGYQTKKFTISGLHVDEVIKLKPLVIALNEVKVGYKSPQLIKVGSTRNSAFATESLLPRMLQAMYMPGSAKIEGTIKSVGFYLSNGSILAPGKGDATAPFRIRLFEADANGVPGRELTSDVIIVAAKKSGRWFDVDISGYKIANPANGFFVAFSLLNADYYKDQNAQKNHSGYSVSSAYIQTPRLGATSNEFKESLSYKGNDHITNISWHRDNYLKYNYLIRAVVVVE
ncbi:MAG: carboxypeptidase-like regulatory domain-containing protein [Mucilaginibacter sp.]